MLHMVLFLLKIIGILIGIIFGLLLILILIVLFVPIRYRLWADNREDLKGRVNITWLLRIISLQVAYVNKTLSIKLKIFGRIFFDNNNPNKGRLRKNSKTSGKANRKKNRNLRKQTLKNNVEKQNNKNKALGEKLTKVENSIDISNTYVEHIDKKELRSIGIEPTIKKENSDEITKQQIQNDQLQNNQIQNELSEFTDDRQTDGFKFSTKLKNILLKVKNFFQRIKIGFEKIKNLFRTIGEFITELITKWDKIKDFYHNESNKQGIKRCFRAVKRIIKHIFPKKIKASIEFGTGDPCTTGQALGVMAGFYGFYGESIQIVPNFNDQIYEGNIYIYGRIRIVTLLIIIVKLLLNKNFKELIKNFRAFKEDL